MIIDADDLSAWERCQRLPILNRKWRPRLLLLRDGIRHFFREGVRRVITGLPPSPSYNDAEEATTSKFLWHASHSGFNYGAKELDVYTVAQDCGSWLDGALRIVRETAEGMIPIPDYDLGGFHSLHIEGYRNGDGEFHVFRTRSNLGDEHPRWPEMALWALGETRDIVVHSFRFPPLARKSNLFRLASPLSVAYRHPAFPTYRLARVEGDGTLQFSNAWKRCGRWELDIPWKEWREGIERDQCLDKVMRVEVAEPVKWRSELKRDMDEIIADLVRGELGPRKREGCDSCAYQRFCHGCYVDGPAEYDWDHQIEFIPRKEESPEPSPASAGVDDR